MTAILDQTTSRGQRDPDTHGRFAPAGQTSPEAVRDSTPNAQAPRGVTAAGGGQDAVNPHTCAAPAGSDHPARLDSSDLHGHIADGAHSSPGAGGESLPIASTPQGAHATEEGHAGLETHVGLALLGPILADPSLAFAADILDDLERTRDSNANRLRQMTRNEQDSDGENRGFGLDASHPDVARMEAMVTTLEQLTKDAAKNLERAVRKHPLGPWIKAQRGIGDKQAGRLLAAVGDPWWNTLHDRPRTVSELWAFCGLHTDGENAARRRKGVKSNWSTNAKTRAWLCIESCMKQIDATCKTDSGIGDHVEGCKCSPYRIVIDERRAHTATTHPEWTAMHSLRDAQRIASKALLRDLWEQARDHHQN